MERNDPFEVVEQLRTWVEERIRSLNTVPPNEAESHEARERYQEITKLINLHEKLRIAVPEYIRTEQKDLNEFLNAPSEAERKLTSLANQLSDLAKNINHQLQGRRSPGTTKVRRSPGKKLKVAFPDGRIICENKATHTFVNTLQHIGLKPVSELPLRLNGHPLVSTKNSSSALQVREVDGYFIATHSNTEQKARCIRQIAAHLRIEIAVEVIERV